MTAMTLPMQPALRNVRLGGVLGKKFGRLHQLAVGSAAEAAHALAQMLPGFEAFMMSSKDQGLEFAVFVDGENVDKDHLASPAARDIRILPIPTGRKSGGIMTIVGAILMVVGYIFIWTPFGTPLIYAGAALMAAGLIMMLSPQPTDNKSEDDPDKRASYAFNGPVNTQAQGNPVPILYGGPIQIGSAVISASIDAAEQAYIPRGNAIGGSGPNGRYGGGSVLSHVASVALYNAENP